MYDETYLRDFLAILRKSWRYAMSLNGSNPQTQNTSCHIAPHIAPQPPPLFPLPSHICVARLIWYPSGHLHTNVPLLLTQVCKASIQLWTPVSHSFTSKKKHSNMKIYIIENMFRRLDIFLKHFNQNIAPVSKYECINNSNTWPSCRVLRVAQAPHI